MKKVRDFVRDIYKNDTLDDKLIILLAVSLFLPYYVTIIYLLFLSIFIFIKRDVKELINNTKNSKYLIIVAIYMLITSLVFQNYLGALISIGLFFVFIVFLFYKKVITKKLFEKIISIMIFMSLLSCIFAVFEQLYYVNTLDTLDSFISFFDISNSPKYRVHAFYFNANYYAMMIVFVDMFCVYRILCQPRNHLYYNFVAGFNLFALFLTGSRFAWLCLIIALIITFIFSKKYIAFVGTLGVSFLMLVLTSLNIPIIPRLLEYGVSLGRRQTIYETASLMVKDTWLFGKGPLTYLHEYPKYIGEYVDKFGADHLTRLGISSQHSHSLFIEPFISFGVIGSVLFIFFLYSQYKDVITLYIKKVDRNLLTLIISCTAVVIMADVFDLPILWIQTGLLFFMIVGATSIYTNKK